MDTWPDGTPKSDNAFNWRKYATASMSDEQTARNNAANATKHIEQIRKTGKDVRAIHGMGSKNILTMRQVIAYSKA